MAHKYDEGYEETPEIDYEWESTEPINGSHFVLFNHYAIDVTFPKNENGKEGLVYGISDGRYVKIGATTNIKDRISKLQCANARKLYLCALCKTDDMFGLEDALHKRFARWRMLNEWFDVFSYLNIGKDEQEEIRQKAPRLHALILQKNDRRIKDFMEVWRCNS